MTWGFLSYIENDPSAKAGWLCLTNDGVDALYVVRGGSGGDSLLNKYNFSSLPNTPVWSVVGTYSIDLMVKGDYVYNLSGAGYDITRYSVVDGELDLVTFYTCVDGFGLSFACTASNWFVVDYDVIRVLDLTGTEILPALSYPALATVIRTDGTYLYVSDLDDGGTYIRKLNLDATPTGVEWDTDEVVTNSTLAVGPDGNIYQLLADGVTVRVYSNMGAILEYITVSFAYPWNRSLTVADELVFVSSGQGGELISGVEVKKYGDVPPPPPPPPPVPVEVRISDPTVGTSGSSTLLCLGGRFFNYLKSWLVDGNIYDKSAKAVPYTNSYIKFPGQAFTTSGNPSAGTDLIIHHRNLDYSTTYGVTVADDGEFSFHLKLGLGENRIWVTTADEQIVSNVLIYNAYYIHFFLCLYSLEFALFRKYYVQMRQNVSLQDYVFGDVPYPDLPSDEDYYTTEQKALVSNFARMLYLPTIPQMTREEFANAIRSVFSAFEVSPMKEAIDLVSIALTGNSAVVFEYFKSHTFELDEEHEALTPYRDFSWKLVAGSTYPTVVPGGQFCWGDNWFRLYNEKKFLVHGNKALSGIPGIPPTGSIWVYVDGEMSGNSLVMKYSEDQPFPFVNYYNESFTPDQVLVDSDGSVTGWEGGLYVKTKYLPVQFDYGEDLADVDPDRTVDLTRATVLPGQSIISLNLINMPVNTIKFYYYYNYEFVILGRVFYTQDEGFFLITDIRRCSRISDKIEEGMVTANSSDPTYLVDSLKSWARDQHLMDRVIFTTGGNKGEGRIIVTNDTNRIDIHPIDSSHPAFPFNPQIGDQYDILSRDFNGAFYLSTRGHQHLSEVYLNDLNLNKMLLRRVTRQVLRDLISLVIPAYKQAYIFFKRRPDALVEIFSTTLSANGQVRNISSNRMVSGLDRLVVKPSWSVNPPPGGDSFASAFGITYGGITYDSDTGEVPSGFGGSNWIIDNSKSYGSNQWVPGIIIGTSSVPGHETQRRLIISNTDRRITVWPYWDDDGGYIIPETYEVQSIEDQGIVSSSWNDYIDCISWDYTTPKAWDTNVFMSLPEGPGYYVDFEYYDKTYRPDRPVASNTQIFQQFLF